LSQESVRQTDAQRLGIGKRARYAGFQALLAQWIEHGATDRERFAGNVSDNAYWQKATAP
jgi:hypothetical protein